jgi:hypothetical protein
VVRVHRERTRAAAGLFGAQQKMATNVMHAVCKSVSTVAYSVCRCDPATFKRGPAYAEASLAGFVFFSGCYVHA